MNIAVAGTGFVGLSMATLLAQKHRVTAVDILPERVDLINNKKSTIEDEYIERYLAEKDLDLTATRDSASAYRDADYVVISGAGGEEWDPEHQSFNYLALGEHEHALLKNVCRMRDEGKISSVIVRINSSNPIEMTFLDTYDVDACMQIGMVGAHGINAPAGD